MLPRSLYLLSICASAALLGCREVGTKNHQWGSTNGFLCNKCRLVSGTPQLIPIECGVVSRFSDRFVTSGLPLILVLCAGTRYFNNAAEIDLGRQDSLKQARAKASEDEQKFVEKSARHALPGHRRKALMNLPLQVRWLAGWR